MKGTGIAVLVWLAILSQAIAQGRFAFINPGAHTRLGSVDGPLAGPGIWAHMLAGSQPDLLSPVGRDAEHVTNGLVSGGTTTVPGIDGNQIAFVQMVAWDGTMWGSMLAGVPPDQLGRTDIIEVRLAYDFQSPPFPFFGRPAIVPIPEPSSVALALLGTPVILFSLRAWRRRTSNITTP